MSHFLIFYAPILVVILSIVAAFWLASKDNIVRSDH
ncbi:cytochrome bd oxidase small subunit CydS [Ectobacillus funiculus]